MKCEVVGTLHRERSVVPVFSSEVGVWSYVLVVSSLGDVRSSVAYLRHVNYVSIAVKVATSTTEPAPVGEGSWSCSANIGRVQGR